MTRTGETDASLPESEIKTLERQDSLIDTTEQNVIDEPAQNQDVIDRIEQLQEGVYVKEGNKYGKIIKRTDGDPPIITIYGQDTAGVGMRSGTTSLRPQLYLDDLPEIISEVEFNDLENNILPEQDKEKIKHFDIETRGGGKRKTRKRRKKRKYKKRKTRNRRRKKSNKKRRKKRK